MDKRWLKPVAVIGLVVGSLAGCDRADRQLDSTPEKAKDPSVQPAPVTKSDVKPEVKVTSATLATAVSSEAGKAVYTQSCRMCHDTGTLNAPRLGDKSAWEARIAQGKDVLYQHAVNGFTGKVGTMPPKGGSNATDSEVKLAVDYMISQAN